MGSTRATIIAEKKQWVIWIQIVFVYVCVCVALGIQHAMRMRHCHLLLVRFYKIFPHNFKKDMTFE